MAAGSASAAALELGQMVGKLIDADTLYGRLETRDELRAG